MKTVIWVLIIVLALGYVCTIHEVESYTVTAVVTDKVPYRSGSGGRLYWVDGEHAGAVHAGDSGYARTAVGDFINILVTYNEDIFGNAFNPAYTQVQLNK